MQSVYTTQWHEPDGVPINVLITHSYLTMAYTCPECEGGIRIVEAESDDCGDVLRWECIRCGWASAALPNPDFGDEE